MKRQIKWHSQHLEIDVMSGKMKAPTFEEEEGEEEYYDEDDYEDHGPIQNVMSTPFGLWKVDDTMNPYKQFKLWMGHTNFTITDEIAEILDVIPGVEVLQILTRYRFVIAVGELFDIHDVRIAIEDSLVCNKDAIDRINDESIKQQVYDLKAALSTYDKWAIYVFPNGQLDFTTSEQEDFGKQLNLFKQAIDYSNGILIESDNE